MCGIGGTGRIARPQPIPDLNSEPQRHRDTECHSAVSLCVCGSSRFLTMISSTFFFLFSQLGVGMMLMLLFISPRSIGNSFFKFASLTAAILLGVTLGFNFLFPSPLRTSQLPVIFLGISALLAAIYNRVVDMEKFTAAFWLLIGATATGLVSVATDSL